MSVLDRLGCAVQALVDKKAVDVLALEVGKNSPMSDWFVIATGENVLHLEALSEGVRKALTGLDHMEGAARSNWILLDYGDIVVHIFSDEARRFYDLERLWGDVPRFDGEELLQLTKQKCADILT